MEILHPQPQEKNMLRSFTHALLTAVLFTLGAGVNLAQADARTLERVIEAETLVVGMSGNQPPLNMINRDGNLMGMDVDLARALANAMQVSLKIETMPFGDLMEALDTGEVDLVISGMAITPERALKARFIGPYMLSGKSILTRSDVIQQLSTGELASKSVKLAALRNSTSAAFVREEAPNSELVEVADYASAVSMIQSGEVAGLVADMPACVLAVLRNPDADLVTLGEPLTVEPLGIAVNADDRRFSDLLANYLENYERAGLVEVLRSRWMENSSWIAALP